MDRVILILRFQIEIRDGDRGNSLKKVINNMRWRTPIAGLTTILFLFLYSAVIINIADFVPEHLFFQTVYFLVAGLIWIPAVVKLIGWANKDE